MTFRPPATKQQRRRSRQGGARRSLYLNIAFGMVTVASVALLAGVLLGNYYTDHWAPVGSVNGSAISKDAVRDRAAVNKARYDRQVQNFQVMRNQGGITSEEYSSVSQEITSKQDWTSLYQEALSQLQGDQVVSQYADKNDIRISDADVDAQIAKDATLEEMRHVKVIGADARPIPPATVPTSAEIAAAKAQAEAYLAELKSGTSWDDVYATSTENGSVGAEGTNTGDLGLVTRDNLNLDPALVDAVFAMTAEGEYTTVFESEDGIFRIATVTKIMASYTDSGWVDNVSANSSGDAYRSAARAEALRTAVRESIEAKYITGATTARRVQEIAVSPGFGGTGSEYKLKLMIFAPNHSVSEAASLTSDDPAWEEAKKRADDAYAALQADPTKFAELAKDTTKNDDQMFPSEGGDVPWISGDVIYDYGQGGTTINMPALRAAVSQDGLEPGILEPFQEPSMGYVVVDFEGSRPSPATRVATVQLLLSLGTLSFEGAVAKYSESSDATKGGDMGWVFHYQLPPEMEQAVFSIPVGSVSRTIQSSSGLWIFKVVEEETRTPDAIEQAKLKKSVWPAWLDEQTTAANIWTDSGALTAITPSAAGLQ
jgi:parvulin-like peptidyl-prolyl isomerase